MNVVDRQKVPAARCEPAVARVGRYWCRLSLSGFSRQKKIALSLSKGFERGVATFYDLPGIPVENGAAVFDQIGQNFLHRRLSERRRVVEFGDELSA